MKKILMALMLCLVSVIGFTSCTQTAQAGSINADYISASSEITCYTSKNGKCYHYKQSCAGKNAYKTTVEECRKLGKTPCSKCVK